jgi:hypothetical protein
MLLHWRNKHTARYYTIHLQRDLLGDWSLTLAWGGARHKAVRVVHRAVASERAGLAAIARITRQREAHGYELVDVDFAARPG